MCNISILKERRGFAFLVNPSTGQIHNLLQRVLGLPLGSQVDIPETTHLGGPADPPQLDLFDVEEEPPHLRGRAQTPCRGSSCF